MGKSFRREQARRQRQELRARIIDRDFSALKSKFPQAFKAWVMFGGLLESRMREEALGSLPLNRRAVRATLKQRKDTIDRHKSRLNVERQRKAYKDHQEQKQKRSLLRTILRRGVA